MITEKKCYTCEETKPTTEFYSKKGSKDGLGHACKICDGKRKKRQNRTERGLIQKIYSDQRKSSKTRGHNPPNYTKQEVIDWAFNQPNFNILYSNWVKSGYKKPLRPSIDRLDDSKGYSLDNIQLITWKENADKGHYKASKGLTRTPLCPVIGYHIETGLEVYFISLAEAKSCTGGDKGDIQKCAQGRVSRITVKGWKWRFPHPDVNAL